VDFKVKRQNKSIFVRQINKPIRSLSNKKATIHSVVNIKEVSFHTLLLF